jgi:hypothetical protein
VCLALWAFLFAAGVATVPEGSRLCKVAEKAGIATWLGCDDAGLGLAGTDLHDCRATAAGPGAWQACFSWKAVIARHLACDIWAAPVSFTATASHCGCGRGAGSRSNGRSNSWFRPRVTYCDGVKRGNKHRKTQNASPLASSWWLTARLLALPRAQLASGMSP